MKRVLLVDDRPENLYLLRTMLQGQYEVVEARHGAEALVKARLSPPDLVVSDLLMPVMDGYTLLRHWRADERLKTIPFIVYTATYTEPKDERLALDLGADAFILKPAEPHAFMARLEEVCDRVQRGELHPALSKDEPVVLREDNQVLVRKLEEKSLQLERANRELERDLAARKRTEEALRESERHYQALADISPVGIFRTDAQGLTTYVNARFCQISGLAAANASGHEWLRAVHAEDRERLEKGWQDASQAQRASAADYRFVHTDGTISWVMGQSVPERDPAGRVVGYVGTVTDVTERKRAEEALQASLIEKEALLKEVHHRVKNNLQVITSLLRMEAGRSAQPATKSVLRDLQGRLHAMALLHEILYRSGTFAAVDLGAYLKQLATQSFRALNSEPGSLRLETDMASLWVEMDQAMPCGLLVNELISNSLKHGFPSGRSGEIRVELQSQGDSPAVRVSVSDSGVGLPKDFELERSSSLGLQLAFDLTRQLGGRLEVGPGPGARFNLTFAKDGKKQSTLVPEVPPA